LTVRRYVLAFALVALATLITRRTQPLLGEVSPFFFVAVMFSTWFGGMGPGLFATGLSCLASAYYFQNIPAGSGAFGRDDVIRLTLFLMVALLISSLVNLRRRAEQQLRNANDHLETRVLQRTYELETSNRKVRESEEGFRALVEGVTDCAICLLDPQGKIVQWNSGAERIQRYSEAEILHRGFELFFPPIDRGSQRPAEQLQRAASAGRFEDEGWRYRADGSTFWAHVIITPLHDEAGILRGFAHVARDITELKRLEKEVLEISENEQRRIGHDLHDGLGQELTGLAFLTQNVRRSLSEQSLPQAAQLDRISSLVNSALEKARDLARGLSPVEWGPDGLSAALRNLSNRVKESYGIPCEFHRERPVHVASHAAAVHLYRIAQEAISNAARHSKAHRIWVSLDESPATITLRIEDDGQGIAPDKTAPSTEAKASGMGLHLMPYRARMIGASFEILPRTGGGTIIQCTYPKSADTSTGQEEQ
jgi:PAS domain S-box-containing protein